MCRLPVICALVAVAGCKQILGLQDPTRAAGNATDATEASEDIQTSSTTPSVLALARAHATTTAAITYALAVPPGASFLLVSVQTGDQGGGTAPTITSVTFDGEQLVRVVAIVGTPVNSATTRSEMWALVSPAIASGSVIVTLSATSPSLHSGAFAIGGVATATPVRDSASASGQSGSSSLSIATAPGDLVIDAVGQGTGIDVAGATQQTLYVDNASNATTLGNTAASTLTATASTAELTWTFDASDVWQDVACDLEPAP